VHRLIERADQIQVMCGRFTLITLAKDIAKEFNLADVPGFQHRFNIAPSSKSLPFASAPAPLAATDQNGLVRASQSARL
jgi:putative SOS response-associated peptidase YedK